MMKSPWRKLATLATSALLLTSGLVGVSSPASAVDAEAPATLFNYENNVVGENGWANMLAYDLCTDVDGNGLPAHRGWGNYANPPTGGSASGAIAVKGKNGCGSVSVVSIGSIDAAKSLLSAEHLTVTMNFYEPDSIGGKVVELSFVDDGYQNAIAKNASALTVPGWQTLSFDFTTPDTGTRDLAIPYNRARIDYDPSSVLMSQEFWMDDVAFNGATPAPLAPATLFNYENNVVGENGWANMLAYDLCTDVDGDGLPAHRGWGNYAGPPSGGSASGTIAVKGKNGCGSVSVVSVGSIGASQSLMSTGHLTVTMNFYEPDSIGGKVVELSLVDNGYQNEIVKSASAVTVPGWQTLSFDFTTPDRGTVNLDIPYNRARIDYDPSSVLMSQEFWMDDVAFNGATPAPLASNVSLTDYDVRLLAAQKDTSTDTYEWTQCGDSWCANNRYYQKMIAAGETTSITYVVTNHSTHEAVAGATVRLRVNTGYSGSNATWASGGTSFGEVSSYNSSDAGVITGTTNSSGEVTFSLTNTNISGEPAITLNGANPYPNPAPVGETKGALEPTVVGATAQYLDVLWPHISSSVLNIKPVSTVDPDNKGRYAHIRLDKSISLNSYDASWWDGVWQYRDVDTKAYLKYIPVRSTFALSYVVTDAYNQPLAGAPVTLIVNANNSCAKTFFSYQGNLIGPDDCSGGGQTELPAQMTDFQGRVTFVLTNTNTKGEAMPSNLSGVPTVGQANEIGTNIKPHLVGATQEGIDMLFAHFVEVTGKPTFSGAAKVTFNTANRYYVGFTLKDASGAPIKNAEIAVLDNDASSSVLYANTDSKGQVMLVGSRKGNRGGTQVIGVSYSAPGELPVTASTTINWVSTAKTASVAGGKRAFTVKIANAKGIRVKIAVAGGGVVYRTPASNAASFKIAAAAGAKSVSVTIAGKTSKHTVKVTK